MFLLFKHKKGQKRHTENAVQERMANSIVSTCLRFQQRWANFMGRHTERLSRKGKLIALLLFCVIAGSLSIYLIAGSVMNRKAPSFKVTHLKAPLSRSKSSDEKNNRVVILPEAEYQRIHRYRLYMDSLARSPSGKKLYDNILIHRPGLMDSLALIEKIYQLQNKK